MTRRFQKPWVGNNDYFFSYRLVMHKAPQETLWALKFIKTIATVQVWVALGAIETIVGDTPWISPTPLTSLLFFLSQIFIKLLNEDGARLNCDPKDWCYFCSWSPFKNLTSHLPSFVLSSPLPLSLPSFVSPFLVTQKSADP